MTNIVNSSNISNFYIIERWIKHTVQRYKSVFGPALNLSMIWSFHDWR